MKTKEGGVMDIQKEREAFNLWLKHYDRHEVKIDQLQRAFMWQAWQAAKAQAVPEGFVLVLKEPNEEMIISGLAVVATGIGKHNIDKEIRKIWEKMIEAQEPAND